MELLIAYNRCTIKRCKYFIFVIFRASGSLVRNNSFSALFSFLSLTVSCNQEVRISGHEFSHSQNCLHYSKAN